MGRNRKTFVMVACHVYDPLQNIKLPGALKY